MQSIRRSRFPKVVLFVGAMALGSGSIGLAQAQAGQQGIPKTTPVSHAPSSAPSQTVSHRTRLVARQALPSSGSAVSSIRVALRQSQASDALLDHDDESDNSPAPKANLRSSIAFVQDLETMTVLYDKNADESDPRPIASITKLMTALVVAESKLPMNETLSIADADVDRLRHSRSRLAIGSKLSRAEMLHLALMSSENRAAHALGRHYPGGMPAFVRAMNDKARSLGMRNTRFVDPTGLSADNVSTPRDLVKLIRAAAKQEMIRRYSTDDTEKMAISKGRTLVYNNTNRLVKRSDWDIALSKTGFINEAGECLVMLTRIDNRDVAVVLLNSVGRYSRVADAVRVRKHVEQSSTLAML